jgi:hypothetical protein
MLAMRQSRAERDQSSLQRRLEVLKLPVVALKRHGYLKPTDRAEWQAEPEAVGVGPDGTAFAVWPHRGDARRKQVTSHVGDKEILTAVDIESDLRVWFVQPLPAGQLLLAAARSRRGSIPNAEVWTDSGKLVCAGDLGDAIEELLTTPSGKVWVGYFDEAMGGRGPEGHGLARFNPDLTPNWLYPHDAGLPYISDCYALNVDGESAHICPYNHFHILSASGEKVTDWGASPYRSAHNLLMKGADCAVLTGWGPEYDVVTSLRIGPDGIQRVGGQCRIVLPDGTEAQRLRYTCRGPDLYAFIRRTWYRTSLNDLADVSADHRR